jgi:RNase P subunit RPR2
LGPGDHGVVTYFWVLAQKRRKYKKHFKKIYLEEIKKIVVKKDVRAPKKWLKIG